MNNNTCNLLVLLGTTAGGKTSLAVRAAGRYGAEIISADSRQVYCGMDLGTGKDLDEYGAVPYHLIDIAAPGSEYNLFRFQRDCFNVIEEIQGRGRLPLICGGTGMYLDAVLRGYRLVEVPEDPLFRAAAAELSDEELRARLVALKPDQHNRTNLEERERIVRALEIAIGEQTAAAALPPLPEISPLVFGLRWPREVLRQRIALRLQQRFDAGMIAEVQGLHAAGVSWEQTEFYGLEYRLIARHLQGELGFDELYRQLLSEIIKFSKRQETFFRRMERNGVMIHWLDGQGDAFADMCRVVESVNWAMSIGS